MFELTGKTALVTGASGGIGKAIATRLHQQGAHVVLHGTREEKLINLANQLGSNSSCITADLSDLEAVSSLVESASKLSGSPIDILINNAGFAIDGLLLRMKVEEWQRVLDVNLTANMILCRTAIRSMIKQKWGRIISISSIVGVTGNSGQTNYSASKAGMIGFCKSLAQEVASRGITVNVVAPGFIQTDMTARLTDEYKQRLIAQIPARRIGQPEDVAHAVAFLASDNACYITGQTMHINGGMYTA